MTNLLLKLKHLFLGDNERSKRANINALLSIIFRGGSILLQLALVPLTIEYVNPNAYGVWITVSSIVSWVALLDVGLANGLKNKLSEALSLGNFAQARLLVSSTYALISLLVLAIFIIYLPVSYFVNWQSVVNATFIDAGSLRNVITIVFAFFLLKFVSDTINVVAAAFQHTAISSMFSFTTNVLLYVAVLILSKTTQGNLLYLALVSSVIPVIVVVAGSIYLYAKKYDGITPAIHQINIKKSASMLSLGAKFFILQVASIIIFQTDNILIAKLFNPAEVTVFTVVYKYYSVVMILFSMVLNPYWTAFTEAYFKRDFKWLEGTVGKLIRLWLLSIIPLVVMFVLCNTLIKLWVGKDIHVIDYKLSLTVVCYVAIVNWNNIYGVFLNGVGKIRIQIICVIIVALINIPLGLFLVKVLHWGVFAMPFANIVSLSLGAIIGYVQYKKIVNNTAHGIWDK